MGWLSIFPQNNAIIEHVSTLGPGFHSSHSLRISLLFICCAFSYSNRYCTGMFLCKSLWTLDIILTISFTSDALVGTVWSPSSPAKRRDFSRASSNSRCFSVSLRDTGIGMASVASKTRLANLTNWKENCQHNLSCKISICTVESQSLQPLIFQNS